MQTVPQTPPLGQYVDGLHNVADALEPAPDAPAVAGSFGELLDRLVYVAHHDDVSSSMLRITDTGHAIAGHVGLKGGAEIVSDSVHVFRAIAMHAAEVADRLEAGRQITRVPSHDDELCPATPDGQHDGFCPSTPVVCAAVHQ